MRLRLVSPEACDASRHVGDGLRRLLSYLSLNDHRHPLIAQHYLEHAPEAATREHMVQLYDYDLLTDHTTKAADYLASVVFSLLLQLMELPAYRDLAPPVDNGIETLGMLHEQLGRTQRQTMMITWMRIVLHNFEDNKQPTKWAFDTSGYDRVASERLPELLKTTLMISKSSGAMYRYVPAWWFGNIPEYAYGRRDVLPYTDINDGRTPAGYGWIERHRPRGGAHGYRNVPSCQSYYSSS